MTRKESGRMVAGCPRRIGTVAFEAIGTHVTTVAARRAGSRLCGVSFHEDFTMRRRRSPDDDSAGTAPAAGRRELGR
jgi:hypothetical protein